MEAPQPLWGGIELLNHREDESQENSGRSPLSQTVARFIPRVYAHVYRTKTRPLGRFWWRFER